MTREEAIEMLKALDMMLRSPDGEPISDVCDALGMAIKALQDDWIPVSERLPEKNGNYIVSLEDAVDTSASFFNGKWFMQAFDSISREYGEHEVFAWKPLPAPYKESEE